MAFDVMLCPETGNVKRRPQHLRKLEKRKKKSTRRTKEEIEEKLKNADLRREVNHMQSFNLPLYVLALFFAFTFNSICT